jgi:SHS2 domain-containing protein
MDEIYKEFDHSGDVGIESWGQTTAQVLENATLGLFSLMVRGEVAGRIDRKLTAEASSDEDLAVAWLSEIITAAATYGEVYGGVRIRSTGEHAVAGVVTGELIDEDRHELRFDVKAATYHGLIFERGGGGCHLRVIYDL